MDQGRGEKLDQAANIGVWAELAALAPSVLLTDRRLRGQAVDDHTATLVVPLGDDASGNFLVRVEPAPGQTAWPEAMCYRDSWSSAKVL